MCANNISCHNFCTFIEKKKSAPVTEDVDTMSYEDGKGEAV